MEIYNKLFKFDKPVSTENECKIASDFTLDLVTSKSTERLIPFLCLIFIRHIIIHNIILYYIVYYYCSGALKAIFGLKNRTQWPHNVH